MRIYPAELLTFLTKLAFIGLQKNWDHGKNSMGRKKKNEEKMVDFGIDPAGAGGGDLRGPRRRRAGERDLLRSEAGLWEGQNNERNRRNGYRRDAGEM